MKAIIFDLDDTLLVEVGSAEAAFIETCRLAQARYGIDPNCLRLAVREQARPLWHASPAREYCLRIGVSSWEGLWARYEGEDQNLKLLRDWASEYRRQAWSGGLAEFGIHDPQFAVLLGEEFARHRRLRHSVYDDVVPVLTSLRGRYKLGLVTNGLSCLQREKIKGGNLTPYFDAVVISGDLGVGKPHPAVFREVLRQLAVEPARAIMVGNGLKTDIAGAQAIGIRGILIDRGQDPHGKDDSIKPEAIIHNLVQLQDRLGSDKHGA